MKAAFSIDETRNVRIQSFLLIGRTCRIFTSLDVHGPRAYVSGVIDRDLSKMSSAGYIRLFQHLAKFIDSADSLSHDVLNPARVPL